LRNWQDGHEGEVEIHDSFLRLSHGAAASLSSSSAAVLGLPDDVHLTLKTDVTGVLGRPDFKLAYEWSLHGRRETPKRTGAFLETSAGTRRVPLWMKHALDLADNFDPNLPMEDHWSALAAFRQALEPDDVIPDTLPENREMAGLSMTAFLRGLEVHVANRFSISPDSTLGQFEVVPYSSRRLDDAGISDDEISENDAELTGEALAVFQHRLRTRGARLAYQLGNNTYLVVDRSSTPVLEEMVRVQQSGREERKAFVMNPRAFITEAVDRHLKDSGEFDDLDEAGQEELVESVAGPALVESREYSARVTGVTVYEKPSTDFESSGTTWLPEVFDAGVADAIRGMSVAELRELHSQMNNVLSQGSGGTAMIDGVEVEITPARLAAVSGELERKEQDETLPDDPVPDVDPETAGPIILGTLDNFEHLSWHAQFNPRKPSIPLRLAELHASVFKPQSGHPPLGLRRLKDEVARDLPQKSRFLHPRLMPEIQAVTYDEAQQKLATGGAGAALKMLHHIRSVSVHPRASSVSAPEEFVEMSARLDATMDVLRRISDRGERVLVFIEHREMQFRFAELVRHYFGLEKVDVINGDTPIPKRQAIVNRFQTHLKHDGGFDMLILGPKAAGTGLTLTAATNVIHLSRWWNPAVEEQCNDRVHRIGQTHPVEVHVPMAVHPSYGPQSFDFLLQSLMQRKRKLASQALWPMGDTRGDLEGLQSALSGESSSNSANVIAESMSELFRRDDLAPIAPDQYGAYKLP